MNLLNQTAFRGLWLDPPTDQVPPGALINDSINFRIRDGKLVVKPGYEKLQSAALLGVPMTCYKHTKVNTTLIFVIFTTTDVYWWDATVETFKLCTPKYGTSDMTATVTTGGAGNRTVTASAGDWSTTTADIDQDDYIGFSTDANEPDPNTVTTWYKILSIDSATQLTLAEDGPVVAAKGFFIRRVFGGGTGDVWECVSYYDGTSSENLLVATNGVNPLQVWDGDIVAPVTYFNKIASANTPTGKHLGMLGGHIVLGNISATPGSCVGTDLPYTILWTAVSNHDEFTAANWAGFQELYETPGEITFIAPFMDALLIVKTDAIILLRSTGQLGSPYNWIYIKKGIGSEIPAYVNADYRVFFISGDDIVYFDGTPELKSVTERMVSTESGQIVVSDIRDALFNSLNYTQRSRTRMVYAPAYREIRIYIPSTGQTSPDKAWVYEVDEMCWARDDAPFCAAGTYNPQIELSISELGLVTGGTTYTAAAPSGAYNGVGDSVIRVNENASAEAAAGYIEIDSDSYYYASKSGSGPTDFTLGADPEGILPTTLTEDYTQNDVVFCPTQVIDDLSQSIDGLSIANVFDSVVACDISGYVYLENASLKQMQLGDGSWTNIEAVAELWDAVGTDKQIVDRFLRTDIFYKDSQLSADNFNVSISVDKGANYKTAQAVVMASSVDWKRKTLSWNTAGYTCRTRITGRAFTISGISIWFNPQGTR